MHTVVLVVPKRGGVCVHLSSGTPHLPGRKLLPPHVCRGATLLGLGGTLCNREHVLGCTRVLYPLVPRRWDCSTTLGTRVPALCTRVPRCSHTLQTLHADNMDDVIQASTGRANPTVNNTQRRHVGMEGTTLLFAAHKPTTKKAGKDKYPLKHPHLDTLRNVVDSKPAMSLPNHSLTSRSPYRWKPELVGSTTPMLMEREDAVLPIPMCHALPLIGTSEPVKQVDVFREVNEELSELGHMGHVFKEEFLAKDGEMLANMKIHADNVGQRWGGVFNMAWPSPNRPPDPSDRVAVYAVI